MFAYNFSLSSVHMKSTKQNRVYCVKTCIKLAEFMQEPVSVPSLLSSPPTSLTNQFMIYNCVPDTFNIKLDLKVPKVTTYSPLSFKDRSLIFTLATFLSTSF